MPNPRTASPLPAGPGRLAYIWRKVLLAVLYLATFVALDWVSLIDPHESLGLTPWSPATGLSLALVLAYGAQVIPLWSIGILTTDWLFRDFSANPATFAATAAIVSAGYGAVGLAIRRHLQTPLRLDDHRGLAILLLAACGLSPLVVAIAVSVLALGGLLAWSAALAAAARLWVGDVIGIAAMVPFFLLCLERGQAGWWRPQGSALAEFTLQALAIVAGLWAIFGIESTDHLEFSYLLFMPLVWIALRQGLRGSAWGIVATQFGLALAMHLRPHPPDVVLQFQLLMLAVALTGLALGATVDRRRAAETGLRSSEARLQTVVRTAPDAIFVYRGDGAVGAMNSAAQALLGRSTSSLPRIEELFPELPAGALNDGALLETVACRSDGSRIAVDLSIGTAEDAGGRLFVAIVRDATARKAAATRLGQRQAEIAEALRLATTGEMAASVAHELNQPLTAMIGFARTGQAILRAAPSVGAIPDSALKFIDRSVQEALRAGNIVRAARERIDRGDVHRTRIGLPALIDEATGLVRTEIENRNVRLRVRVEKDLPDALVDPTQIVQVVLNLLRNAVEAMESVDVRSRDVVLSAARAGDDPGFAEIAVEDSGPGFDPEMAEQLFRPFSSTKQGGMGMGLAICRSIVEAHGGRIWAEARGHGACVRFTVTLYEDARDGRR